MSRLQGVSYAEWLTARKALLQKEKELTQWKDAINAERRSLPLVRVEKDYQFTGEHAMATLLDLFEGRQQLIVYHFMFDPQWDKGCPSCSSAVDQLAPRVLDQLHDRHTSFVCISRAPYDQLDRYKQAKHWTVPWYSSFGSDFNYDFHVSLDPSRGAVEYNYLDEDEFAQKYADVVGTVSEMPGYSCFVRDETEIFHTYSTYARGTENAACHTYALLDLTFLGRQEPWEEPKGRAETLIPEEG